jgi:hypothetical protein
VGKRSGEVKSGWCPHSTDGRNEANVRLTKVRLTKDTGLEGQVAALPGSDSVRHARVVPAKRRRRTLSDCADG